MKRIRFLTLKQVGNIHDKAIGATGGLMGLRDKGLLDSAIHYPKMLHGFGQTTNICELAAAYGHRIIKNHAFVDGNKRTGVLVMLAFLNLNGVETIFDEAELYELALQIAESKKSYDDLVTYLKKYARKKPKKRKKVRTSRASQ